MYKLTFILSILFFFTTNQHLFAQLIHTDATISKIELTYKGKTKNARRITVSSEYEFPRKKFWIQGQIVENTNSICKPLTNLNIKHAPDSPFFLQDSLYVLKPLSLGFIPLGGKHFIFIEEINQEEYFIQTREYNSIAKIWDHKLEWEEIENQNVVYSDDIELYAGFLTPVFAWYLKQFYKSRHRNWEKILTNSSNIN